MKRIIVFCLFAGSLAFFVNQFVLNRSADAKSIAEELHTEPEIQITKQGHTISEGDTFTIAMEALGFSYADALAIVDAAEEVFDFTKVKLGKDISVISEDGIQKRIEYEPNSDEVVVVDLENNFETQLKEIEYDISVEQAYGRIDQSLFLTAINQGLSELLVIKFADVLAWEIDFATQVQQGDEFFVVYEKRSRHGENAGIGNVLKAEFTNTGKKIVAYRYETPEGDSTYYSENGDSLVRPFLKAPLSYSRITSGYSSARFHPITGRTAPHLAIDYAAPTGTPIMAVADGKVYFASWSRGYGNYIKITHNGTYRTNYAHLSRFNVSSGDFVKQGDVIGYVGSTGWSTGPHLHYEVEVNGVKQNPLEVEFPRGNALPEDQTAEFERQKQEINTNIR